MDYDYHHETLDEPPFPMPWTWYPTDDETGVNVYDHTDDPDPVLTLPARDIVTRNGVPIKPDVRGAVSDYLAERSGERYTREAAVDLALWGVVEAAPDEDPTDRDAAIAARPADPPTDTAAARAAADYDRQRESAPPASTGDVRGPRGPRADQGAED